MGITFIGIFLPRERRQNWVHPRLLLSTRALTEMRQSWVVQTKVRYFELPASRLHRCTARCVDQRRCSFCRTTTTILTTMKRRMRPSPSRPTILCCNQQGPRSAFGIPNFCLIQIDRQDFQDRIVPSNQLIVRLGFPMTLVPCPMVAC